MNVTNLTKVAQGSRAADAVFKYLAGRDRASWNQDLSRVFAEVTKDGKDISRTQFNKVFEDLQKAGAGTIILGRRGGATRFQWQYNFRNAAIQTLTSMEAAKKPVPKVQATASKQDVAPTIIQLTIPSTVSKDEIKALLELAKSLTR